MTGYGGSPARSTSAAREAIGLAARQLGLPDPVQLAGELLEVDVDALHEWFTVAARVEQNLLRGAHRLQDALPVLAAGWSSGAPRLAVTAGQGAGLASRAVVDRQVVAADQAGSVLRQTRQLADADLDDTEAAVLAAGWPPGEDLVLWSAAQGQVGPMLNLIAGLSQRMGELQVRSHDALHELALVLRADPRDPVQEVAATARAAGAPPATMTGQGPAWSGLGGAAGPSAGIASGAAGSVSGSAGGIPGSAGPAPSPAIDQANLDRLAADLASTDVATVMMALGVQAALDRARAQGGVAQLLIYQSADSGGQGRAAISVGDITCADNVATVAPGISNAPVNMADGVSSAAVLRDRAQELAPGESTAAIAWYGYDIPLSAVGGVPVDMISAVGNTAAAVTDATARVGGGQLVDDMARFRDWAPETARFVAVGFSMGSTTVSAAAARGGRFDDLVLLGSPGASSDVATADNYPDMPAEHAFVVAYDEDPVTRGETDLLAGLLGGLGRLPSTPTPFGPDPAAAKFGAQVIDADSNNPDVSVALHLGGPLPDIVGSAVADEVADLAAHHQEANYLSGESLGAVAAVVVGQYSEVPIKPGR